MPEDDEIFDQWVLLESDFHEFYGVDLEQVLRERSWRWFRTRVVGLFSCDSRLYRYFKPDEDEPVTPGDASTDEY